VITGRAKAGYLWVNGLETPSNWARRLALWAKALLRNGRYAPGGDRPPGAGGRRRAGRENLGEDRWDYERPSHYVARRRAAAWGAAGSKHLKAIVVRGNQRPDYPIRKLSVTK